MADEGKTIINVIVSKSITLLDGETLGTFTRTLGDTCRDYLKKKLALGDKSDVWVQEVKETTCVASVYRWDTGQGKSALYQVSYSRDKAGEFQFEAPLEVRTKISYEPVLPATKAVTATAAGVGSPVAVGTPTSEGKLVTPTSKRVDTGDSVIDAVEVTKALWDTAYVDKLPDSAFAAILPGGKKDKEGKTVPRSLRALPHHNASVKSADDDSSVDIPHLKNALARVNQLKAPSDIKAKAKAHLEAHAKRLLKSDKPKEKVAKDFWQSLGI